MKLSILPIAVIACMLLLRCDSSIVDNEAAGDIRFELLADVQSGAAPLTVNFTGVLHGELEGLRLCPSRPVLCPGYGKICIIFCPGDTTYAPKRTYQAQAMYADPGQYRAFMKLGAVNRTIHSDTLTITVRQKDLSHDRANAVLPRVRRASGASDIKEHVNVQ